MDVTHKEIAKALTLIQNECYDQQLCVGCAFYDDDEKKCWFAKGNLPKEWNIHDSNCSWKAFLD
jgi:hypothetical protein